MKAVLVWRDGAKATVRLRPSWLARLFGARETQVSLVAVDSSYGTRSWLVESTRRDIDHLWEASAIRQALEFTPVNGPPTARVVTWK